MDNYKIIITFFALVFFGISCKEECNGSKGVDVVPFPHPYENYFNALPNGVIGWSSNNGLTDNYIVYSYSGEPYTFRKDEVFNNGELNENCRTTKGFVSYISYRPELYSTWGKNYTMKLQYTSKNELLFQLFTYQTVSDTSYFGNLYFRKVLNVPDSKFKAFVGYPDTHMDKNEYPISDSAFSIADTIQVSGKVYHNVMVIDNTIGKKEGDGTAVNKFYIDPYIGAIKLELNNGEVWSINK